MSEYDSMNLLTRKRVKLTRSVLKDFYENAAKGSLSALSKQTGLAYGLLYNIAHRRVKSISIRDYRKIFNKDPIVKLPDRRDGSYFRDMVRLWLYLNEGQTENILYQEFFQGKKAFKKTDYRIFTGEIDTIECWLEDQMEQKFLELGLERPIIQNWIRELNTQNRGKRIPYREMKPVLEFIQDTVNIHPTRLLKQSVKRYETGTLHTVSSQVFEHAMQVKKEIEQYLDSNQTIHKEKLLDGIYGKRAGFIPFYEIEEKLEFLREYGGHYPKKYLGRGIGYYRKKKIKRIASWRGIRIDKDCREIIQKKPDLRLSSLPRVFQYQEVGRLLSVLKKISIQQICHDNNVEFEADILRQVTLDPGQYPNQEQVLVRFDEAARYLKMKQKAFDYLVASHSSLFKKIAVRKENGWYIPDISLEMLKKIAGFSLIKGKYDFLASRKDECYASCYGSMSRAIGSSR
jgi:hypothetical protein